MPKRKMIYLMGLDRSGSTICGTIFGNHPEIAHFGELQFYPKAVLNNRILNNNQSINETPFWQTINQQMVTKFGEEVFQEFSNLKIRYERWRNLPLMLLHHLVNHAEFKQYLALNIYLIEILLTNASKPIICDSSKNAVRRIALGLSGFFDIKTIFLIRDARGYYWSIKKRLLRQNKMASIFKITFKWMTNNLMFALMARLGGFLRLRYELVFIQPKASFEKIGKYVDLNLMDLAEQISGKRPFQILNVIAGNLGVRGQQAVIAALDASWEKQLTQKEKNVVLAFSGWLLLIFGYSLSLSHHD